MRIHEWAPIYFRALARRTYFRDMQLLNACISISITFDLSVMTTETDELLTEDEIARLLDDRNNTIIDDQMSYVSWNILIAKTQTTVDMKPHNIEEFIDVIDPSLDYAYLPFIVS